MGVVDAQDDEVQVEAFVEQVVIDKKVIIVGWIEDFRIVHGDELVLRRVYCILQVSKVRHDFGYVSALRKKGASVHTDLNLFVLGLDGLVLLNLRNKAEIGGGLIRFQGLILIQS